jgi:heme A synthase
MRHAGLRGIRPAVHRAEEGEACAIERDRSVKQLALRLALLSVQVHLGGWSVSLAQLQSPRAGEP